MKTILLTYRLSSFFILLSILFTINGCSKNDIFKDIPNNSMMEAKVDGKLVKCDVDVSTAFDLSWKIIGVQGRSSEEGVRFQLHFPIKNGVRSYSLSTYEGWLYHSGFGSYKSTSGSVVITKATSDWFEGTFSFTAELWDGSIPFPSESSSNNKKNITEGVFKVKH